MCRRSLDERLRRSVSLAADPKATLPARATARTPARSVRPPRRSGHVTAFERRTDARGARWWSIFRTESADSSKPRVAWSDFGKNPRAAVLRANDTTVLLNSCYVVRCNDMTDAFALATLLNSPLAAAWLNTIAEPARGGYHRYLGWTVALLPIPEDWKAARNILAPLAKNAIAGTIPSSNALLAATVRVYGLHESDVEPLVLWNGR